MTRLEFLKTAQHVERTIQSINQTLAVWELQQKGEQDMAVSADLAAFITAIDAATDKIAARIAALIASSGTMSADDKAALQGEVDKLNLIGQDPNNPLPPATV